MMGAEEFDILYKNVQGKFIVRLYDGFDNLWIDISEPVSLIEAKKIWLGKTHNGTEKIHYENIDYYDIFPR